MQNFEDTYRLGFDNLTQVNEWAHMPIGTVLLVRSLNVPELGDHYIVIIGRPVMKEHGLRPLTLMIKAPNAYRLFHKRTPILGATVLKLNLEYQEFFHQYYSIRLDNGIHFPTDLIVDEIMKVFEEFRPTPTNIDNYTVGKPILHDRITKFVENNEPIKFSMLGYPFKSRNIRDKVLGDMPDFGEQKSLEHIRYFNSRIRQIYNPGIKISVISDGLIFSDLWGICDDCVDAYGNIVRDIGKCECIQFYDMRDFYPLNTNMDVIREKIVSQHGITSEELERRILLDPNVNALYRGMIFFMFEELAMDNFPSKTQHQKQAKIKAREMMFRNEAYTNLIHSQFGDHIRLSIHNSTNDGTKYSFQLIKGGTHSPWHAALVVHKDESLSTMHKIDAINAGHELVSVDGKPYYFQEV